MMFISADMNEVILMRNEVLLALSSFLNLEIKAQLQRSPKSKEVNYPAYIDDT